MERESFEDEAVAEILNRHFISIKVDREERPDVDHVYMEGVPSADEIWRLAVNYYYDAG